jgi:amidohydrolase family protein
MRGLTFGLLALAISKPAMAQQPLAAVEQLATPVAFVNVRVVPMDSERLEANQVVVVRNGRIVTIGTVGDVTMPNNAIVVDGAERYLMPGLTDAHAHLDTTGGGTRSDFGDAPLYLASGVTSVINLRGTPEHLAWKRRVESGDLLGPTIYTSGPFVEEPRVRTPDEVEREVLAQVQQGYDVIKFHPIGGGPADATTTGLAREAYLRMNEVAREATIPLIGHGPSNLGLDAIVEARQPLAHVSELTNVYFLDLGRLRAFALLTGASLLVIVLAAATGGVFAILGRLRIARRPSPPLVRARVLTGWLLLCSVLTVGCFFLVWPGGLLFDSLIAHTIFTAVAAAAVVLVVVLAILSATLWRATDVSLLSRTATSLVALAAVGIGLALALYWIPLAWRSTDTGIERVATVIGDAGIPVATTLVVNDTLVGLNGQERSRILEDSSLNALQPELQDRWRSIGQFAPPFVTHWLIPKSVVFAQRLTAALDRHGVAIMAGTDAMGAPFVAPGTSLHRELELLVESGLTPYAVLRAVTVTPATFLGREKDFGTVRVGMRADLLLLEGNPLEDIATLRHPVGVMVRGQWLTREALDGMVTVLR